MKRLRIKALGWLALACAAVVAAPSQARADAASPWFQTDQGKVRLIAARPSVAGASKVVLGLEFVLAPHWKIYWRSPGDAGYPPHLDWAGSDNLAGAAIAWPAPERFSVQGLETAGYEGTVVLPIAARLTHPGAPLRVKAQLDYLTCREICVPYKTTLALDLPASGGGSAYGSLIAHYQAQVPGDGKRIGIALESATLRPGSAPLLEIRVKSAHPLAAPDAFVESAAGVGFGAPVARAAGPDETVLRVPVGGDWRSLPGKTLRVTLVDGGRAMTGTVVPVRGSNIVNLATLATMLGLALLGGFILNLMPCVLPVLSLKLLAAFPKEGDTPKKIRRGFLGTALGIVISFLALAVVSAAFKSAGLAFGWGVQFQNPYFLVFLTAVVTLFACNLWGFFEVPLPQRLAALGERTELGNIGTGAFVTLLAVPCSAPFLGTALGFALSTGPREIVAIFLALGIGMALPYLVVAAAPRLATLLPRPGSWMIHLRRVLGLLLALTAAWLLYVLASEIGAHATYVVAALMVVAAATLAFLHETGPRRATLAVAFLAAMLVPAVAPPPAPAVANEGIWRPFEPEAIGALVRDGNIVFVNVTADWCLTCKVNERFVLDAPRVRHALAAEKVIAMRADWTRPDPKITAYLDRFGRYGIPFDAVYGPSAPAGMPLPELLTTGIVTKALDRAAGR